MDNPINQTQKIQKLGFHYYPDTCHFREIDLANNLPTLQSFGASFLILKSDPNRAIPEPFVHALLEANIQPVIDFELNFTNPNVVSDLPTLVEAYAHWGIQYISFFSRPNSRSSWRKNEWTQNCLVDRYLDAFVPLANLAVHCGVSPIFSPLEPGGNFWDTAFLRAAFEGLARRNQETVIDHMILSAYGWTFGRDLNWGSGGPSRWPEARPYFTPPDMQDQRGFRTMDWYAAISEIVFQRKLPMMIFEAGSPGPNTDQGKAQETNSTSLEILQALASEKEKSPSNPLPSSVIASNYWLLTTDAEDNASKFAVVMNGELTELGKIALDRLKKNKVPQIQPDGPTRDQKDRLFPIRHYLLIPLMDGKISDWHFDLVRPFIKKHRPTVGFSPREALMASQVTVIGDTESYPSDFRERLEAAGCEVDWIGCDGTLLAER